MKRAILLVDHGSRRPEANQQLEELAEILRARLPELDIATAHLEIEAPDIAQGLDARVAAGAEDVTLLPYFLAPGRHSRFDLPQALEAARARHPGIRFRLAQPLGLHAGVIDAVVARIDEAR